MNNAAANAAAVAVVIGILAVAGVFAWRLLRRRKARAAARRAYEAAPVPPHWKGILRRRVPAHARLPADVRRRLHRWMKIFLAEKTFTACGGIRVVGDAMAVAIAGHACLLLAGRDPSGGGRGTGGGGRGANGCFPTVESVLVYPDFFYGKTHDYNPASGAEIVGEEARLGEASPMGSVVLSWREVLRAGAFAGNGSNIVLHEFAHHVRPAGAALLALLEAGFRRLREDPGGEPVLDDYGAESRDEFWAVSVEAFFENSRRLRAAHPEWYRALAAFFALDPAEWE